jgi:hypothetical protein
MTITQAVSTGHLMHILHSLALQSQTGLLRVERADGEEREQGEIFFERGDTAFARVAADEGEAALARVMGWQEVTVSFHEGVVAPPELRRSRRIAPRSAETGSLLPIELQKTRLLPVMAQAVPATGRETLRQTPVDEIPAVLRYAGSENGPAIQQRARNSALFGELAFDNETGCIDAGSIFRVRPGVATRRIIYQLDRRERLVFLLLDGKRTIHEVARLIHRRESDVAHVLARFNALRLVERVDA